MIDIISGIKDVIKLEDPINKILAEIELDDNLILKKVSCPIGLIAVIFEARPDVISQISSLCIKSSNAVILKGVSEEKRIEIMKLASEYNYIPNAAARSIKILHE